MHDFARESQKPTSDFSEMTGWLSEKIVHSVRSLPRRGPTSFPLPNRVADRGFEGVEDGGAFLLAPHGILRLRLAALRSG